MSLPVRPYPEQGESLPGYLLRIAESNGWPSINSLVSAIGIPSRIVWARLSCTDFEQTLLKLAVWLERSPDELRRHFAQQVNHPLLFDSSRHIQDLRVETVRVCPQCMQEQAVLRFEWSLLLYHLCTKHGTELLQACPCCGEQFQAVSDLFHGCPHCKRSWLQLQGTQVTPCPLQTQINSWLNSEDSATIGEMRLIARSLTTAIVVTARPFDSMYQSLQKMPEVDNLSLLIRSAFGLLASAVLGSKTIDDSLLDSRADLKVLGSETCCYGVQLLRDQIKRFPLHERFIKALESYPELSSLQENELAATAFVGKKRLSLLAGRPHSELRYQCTSHEVASALNVDKRLISPLIKRGILPAESLAGPGKFIWLDIRSAVSIIRAHLNPIVTHDNIVTVSRHSKILMDLNRKFAELILAVVSGEIRGQITDLRTRFKQLNVVEAELIAWAKKSEKNYHATALLRQ
ncbi:hypothetical protein ABIE61_003715 [Marinobacterium sp. MBR-111]